MHVLKERTDHDDAYFIKKYCVQKLLTQLNQQYKKQRGNKKLTHIQSKYVAIPAENVYERRREQTLTSLLYGEIWIYNMLKMHNLEAIIIELIARG